MTCILNHIPTPFAPSKHSAQSPCQCKVMANHFSIGCIHVHTCPAVTYMRVSRCMAIVWRLCSSLPLWCPILSKTHCLLHIRFAYTTHTLTSVDIKIIWTKIACIFYLSIYLSMYIYIYVYLEAVADLFPRVKCVDQHFLKILIAGTLFCCHEILSEWV